MRWDDEAKRWIIKTNRNDAMKARFVVMANGPLHRPKLPGIPGVQTYKGHSFHTSRWDYDYTGGDSNGNLTGLKDKVVGIIGTGATAVQCVPFLGEAAKHLYVFQRTPSSVDVRGNRPTDPEWAASLEPGWQRNRMDNFNILVNGGHQEEDLVADGWTDIFRSLRTVRPHLNGPNASAEDFATALELVRCLQANDTRAERLVVQLQEHYGGRVPQWLRQVAKAVDALEYEAAVKVLQERGLMPQ